MIKNIIEKLKECNELGYYTEECPECGGIAKVETDTETACCLDCGHNFPVKRLI